MKINRGIISGIFKGTLARRGFRMGDTDGVETGYYDSLQGDDKSMQTLR